MRVVHIKVKEGEKYVLEPLIALGMKTSLTPLCLSPQFMTE